MRICKKTLRLCTWRGPVFFMGRWDIDTWGGRYRFPDMIKGGWNSYACKKECMRFIDGGDDYLFRKGRQGYRFLHSPFGAECLLLRKIINNYFSSDFSFGCVQFTLHSLKAFLHSRILAFLSALLPFFARRMHLLNSTWQFLMQGFAFPWLFFASPELKNIIAMERATRDMSIFFIDDPPDI